MKKSETKPVKRLLSSRSGKHVINEDICDFKLT